MRNLFKTRHQLLYVLTLVLCCACEIKHVLLDNSWIVIEQTYNGNIVDFYDSGILYPHTTLFFEKDKTIILPGIKYRTISAKWSLEYDVIRFTVDSAAYSSYDTSDTDISMLNSSDSVIKSTDMTIEQEIINPLTTDDFKTAMKFYSQPFRYNIIGDTLILTGPSSKIVALRDNRVDQLFEDL